MTRGHPPWVAIEEAMHHAERIGYLVPGMNTARIPSRFPGHPRWADHARPGQETHGYGRYGIPDIQVSCRREIRELQSTPLSWETGRELSGSGVRTGTGTGMSSSLTG